ncbi:Uma2 family endonuclease [Anatilimnocola sp. NA78]|uniref:Uma2 family endonuclease n=1 Tax=Anatilimnocola sp. NA78 TaxID=3415683 RepID=UPI003CE4BDFA
MIVANSQVTPEQLLAMPDSKGFEIVAGKLVENKVGAESSQLAMDIVEILFNYLRNNRLGRVYGPDTSFQCFPHDETMVRKPDVAFLSYARWPADKRIGAFIKVAPELAIEVLSPNDVIKEVNDKVDDYLAAGVSTVWVVKEFRRYVEVHSANEASRIASLNDELMCEGILPGFRCQVSEIFAHIPQAE